MALTTRDVSAVDGRINELAESDPAMVDNDHEELEEVHFTRNYGPSSTHASCRPEARSSVTAVPEVSLAASISVSDLAEPN
jgi:hypothetical protein